MLRPAGSAAAPTPGARRAISPPKISYGCSTDLASAPGSTSSASPPPAYGWRTIWDGRARPAPFAPSPTRTPPTPPRSSDTMTIDHRLPAEYEELRRTVEEFAHDVVAPKIGEFYEHHEFPYEI